MTNTNVTASSPNIKFNDSTSTKYPLTLPGSRDNDYSHPNYQPAYAHANPGGGFASGGFGLANQDLTTRVTIIEYEEIPQGYYSTANNSGAGNPGSGQPGDPGIVVGTGSTAPTYTTKTYPISHSSTLGLMITGGAGIPRNSVVLGGAGDYFNPSGALVPVGGNTGFMYWERTIDNISISNSDPTQPSVGDAVAAMNNNIYMHSGSSSGGTNMRWQKLTNWQDSYITTKLTNVSTFNAQSQNININPALAQIPNTTTDLTVYAGEIITIDIRV